MSIKSLKKIGEVAKLLETTPRTLRFYEEEGLVSACKTTKGTRYYSEADISRFKAILRLSQAGLSISLIKELATTRAAASTGAQSSQQIDALLLRLSAQIEEKIRFLQQLNSELQQSDHRIHACFDCQNPPSRTGCPQCPLNQQNHLDLLNLIWEQVDCPEPELSR